MAKITNGSAAAQMGSMKVLLAVDGSSYSAAAAEGVERRPWPTGTTVRVLSVVRDAVPTAVELYAAGGLEETRRLMDKRLND